MGFVFFLLSLSALAAPPEQVPGAPAYIDYGYQRWGCYTPDDYGMEIRQEEQRVKVEFDQLVVKSELDARVCLYVLREDGTEDQTRVALRAIPYEKYWIDVDDSGQVVRAQTTKVPEARLEAPELRKVWPVNMNFEAVQSLKWMIPLDEVLPEADLKKLKDGRLVELELDFCYHRFGTYVDSKNKLVPVVALCEATKRLYQLRKKPGDAGYEVNAKVLLNPSARRAPVAPAPTKSSKEEVLEGLKF